MLASRLFVPINITPVGRAFMSVLRNDHVRVIAFREYDDAQSAIDAVACGRAVHVVNASSAVHTITSPFRSGHKRGEYIVLETSAEMLSLDMQNFGVDLCHFMEPNVINLESSFLVDMGDTENARNMLERTASYL